MVLYMTDSEQWGASMEELDEQVYVKMLDHQANMECVVQQELKQISAASHVIVDAGAIDMKTWQAAADTLAAMKTLPLLLVVDEPDLPDTFMRLEHYDQINRANRDIQELLVLWIQNAADPKWIPENMNHIWIAAAGLTPGAGTTALAMHLGQYIQKQGGEVSVTERGTVFEKLAVEYGFHELAEGSYQWGGVVYNQKQVGEEQYTIFDLGRLTQGSYSIWKQCVIKILVVDGKPYRRIELDAQLMQLREFPGNLILAFTFVPEAEKPKLRKRYQTEQVRVWFVPIEPDLFLTDPAYQDLVNPYIHPAKEEKKREKRVIPFRHRDTMTKSRKIVGGILLLAFLCLGSLAFYYPAEQMAADRMETITIPEITRMARMDTDSITRFREQMLAEETTEAVPTEIPVAEETTETEEASGNENEVAATTGTAAAANQQAAVSTEVPVAEVQSAMPESTTTEAAQPGIAAPLTPSLKGYHGQIYTGSQVASIMNKFGGQPVAIHLITRAADGWYNYRIDGGGLAAAASVGSGIGQIDTQCSFLCQVVQVNGEDVGLEFVQQ